MTGEHSFNGDRPELVEHDWFDQILFVLGLFLFIITAIVNIVADIVVKGRGARHH